MVWDSIKDVGLLFYIISPFESMFENPEDIPKPSYFNRSIPGFLGLIILENLILYHKGKGFVRFNDGLSSIGHGLLMLIKDVAFKGWLLTFYCYIYDNYKMYDLPWNYLSTWIIAALLCDFVYYVIHRASHEFNILWAAHQVHHSSEEYNLTTALRQSIWQSAGTMPFYLPLALCVPPSHVLVHIQLNTLFQFWIHTEAIESVGPFEYILNTPQHHRVHHGSNRYCLDKNYAGALIIWDRMFGTFEWERKDMKIIYGLVDQPQFFNPLKHQFFYYGLNIKKSMSMDNFWDKMSAFFKGPGWFPGTGRLGDYDQVPEIQHRNKYDPKLSIWANIYVLLNYVASVLILNEIGENVDTSSIHTWIILGSLFWTVNSAGWILDRSKIAWFFEILRCAASLVYLFADDDHHLGDEYLTQQTWKIIFSLSLVFSIVSFFTVKEYKPQEENEKKNE